MGQLSFRLILFFCYIQFAFSQDTLCIYKAKGMSLLEIGKKQSTLKKGALVILESTSPVGTTNKMQKLIFEERPELKGELFIAYCPERVLPGNIIYENRDVQQVFRFVILWKLPYNRSVCVMWLILILMSVFLACQK